MGDKLNDPILQDTSSDVVDRDTIHPHPAPNVVVLNFAKANQK